MEALYAATPPPDVSAEDMLYAYSQGVFPMAPDKDAPFDYVWPNQRTLLPIDRFHVPRSLLRSVRLQDHFVSLNADCEAVIQACANRESTWISPKIMALFLDLHKQGHAHSVEVWNSERALIGGLYGLSIGAAFFGESMFSHEKNASKIALVHLVARLQELEFDILDAQLKNKHLDQFGAFSLQHEEFYTRLQVAIERPVSFLYGAGSGGKSSDNMPSCDVSGAGGIGTSSMGMFSSLTPCVSGSTLSAFLQSRIHIS